MDEERKIEIFSSVLKILHDHGVLKDMVLIGSWCQLFYKDMFTQGAFVPVIRTKDMDILVPRPRNVSTKVNVSNLLESLDFETELSITSGYKKYTHEDFTVEFLMPLRGSGIKDVEQVKSLSIAVQGLRYLDFPREELMKVTYKGCALTIPSPEAFALLKFMVHEERKNPEKKMKDLQSAQDLGSMLVKDEKFRDRLKRAFNRRPKKHQSRLLRITKEKALDVYEVLKDEK